MALADRRDDISLWHPGGAPRGDGVNDLNNEVILIDVQTILFDTVKGVPDPRICQAISLLGFDPIRCSISFSSPPSKARHRRLDPKRQISDLDTILCSFGDGERVGRRGKEYR